VAKKSMTADNIYESLRIITENEELSFECRKNIIKALAVNEELADRLELRFIELIDLLLNKASDDNDRKELLEIKLISLNYLYYPPDFLKKNNIYLRAVLSEYLELTDADEMTQKEAEVLSCYMTDPVFAKDIDSKVLNRLNEKDRIIFILELQRKFKNPESDIIGHCTGLCSSVIDRAEHMQSLRQRLHILRLLFTVTHPQLCNEIYFSGLSCGYSYENICTDWYWTVKKELSEDYYVTNKIISSEESDILYRIGLVINRIDLSDIDNEQKAQLLELYDAFISGRQFTEVLFGNVNSMG